MRAFEGNQLQDLMDALQERGYTLIAPTRRDGAIVYDEVDGVRDLPAGWTDDQSPGTYRLKRRDDSAFFGYNVGPHSWKRFLFPPSDRLWSAELEGQLFQIHPQPPDEKRYAYIGMRACELAAVTVQDRVLLDGEHQDPAYQERRSRAFFVAVECRQAAPTCFCASMGTGPAIESENDLHHYDLSLAEVVDGGRHFFLVQGASERGEKVLTDMTLREASSDEVEVDKSTALEMTSDLPVEGWRESLLGALEDPRWSEIEERCLACGNCTLTCPTCFCVDVEDSTDLGGTHTERWRHWDSCFNTDHSYLHGGSVRVSTESRYRQWLTHKLATWVDQFDTTGCVGCGRCIVWCPVGIDIREEANRFHKKTEETR